MNNVLNKITKLIGNLEVESERLSNSDCYIKTDLNIEQIESIFNSMEDYEIKFVKVENITYN